MGCRLGKATGSRVNVGFRAPAPSDRQTVHDSGAAAGQRTSRVVVTGIGLAKLSLTGEVS
jgi:hypothetical protein